jgi:heme-degrading monooxygenase HmoA
MYAQVVQGGTAREQRAAMDRIVRDELLPALREEPGFSGAVSLVDRGTGSAMMVVFWETEAQATRGFSQYGARFKDALAQVARVSTDGQQLSVWEVNVRV